MRKTNMKIKENISFADKINAINLWRVYFSFDDNRYTDNFHFLWKSPTMEAYVKYSFEGLI